jgi:hypothetical protein
VEWPPAPPRVSYNPGDPAIGILESMHFLERRATVHLLHEIEAANCRNDHRRFGRHVRSALSHERVWRLFSKTAPHSTSIVFAEIPDGYMLPTNHSAAIFPTK